MKWAVKTEPFASSYSFEVKFAFNSAYSFCQCSLSLSNTCGMPPQPIYFARILCSSGVGFLFSLSSNFTSLIAAILSLNFVFAPPILSKSALVKV